MRCIYMVTLGIFIKEVADSQVYIIQFTAFSKYTQTQNLYATTTRISHPFHYACSIETAAAAAV